MAVYTTEITSDSIPSDNPLHQRLLKPYYEAEKIVHGDLLELGCGEGRGVDLLAPKCKSFTAIDKISDVIERLAAAHPAHTFIQANIPPISQCKNESFDFIVSFQVIEHIKADALFLSEIARILKPGGKALITTPNIKMTLSRNPWHIREYTGKELKTLAEKYFNKVTMQGIAGNEKVMQYYEMNKKSVHRIMKWDILNLQYLLPAAILKIPYEILNRRNRNKLSSYDDRLVMEIQHADYEVSENADTSLDLFCILEK
ncbi:MAG: class I SAM-dependent methyltransferase [Cyclobacteriaceae bacterium]